MPASRRTPIPAGKKAGRLVLPRRALSTPRPMRRSVRRHRFALLRGVLAGRQFQALRGADRRRLCPGSSGPNSHARAGISRWYQDLTFARMRIGGARLLADRQDQRQRESKRDVAARRRAPADSPFEAFIVDLLPGPNGTKGLTSKTKVTNRSDRHGTGANACGGLLADGRRREERQAARLAARAAYFHFIQ